VLFRHHLFPLAKSVDTPFALSLATVLLLFVEVMLVPVRGVFFLVGGTTVFASLLLIIWCASRDIRFPSIVRCFENVGLQAPAINAPFPTVGIVYLFCAGLQIIAFGFFLLALTANPLLGDPVLRAASGWALIDKRIIVYAYLFGLLAVVFWWYFKHLLRPPIAVRATVYPLLNADIRVKMLTTCVIVVIAASWFALPWLIRGLNFMPDYYFENHTFVHLGALEDIRLGARPYVEAQTQYGIGNQLLVYTLMRWLHWSNHGFYAAVLLINSICVLVFFAAVNLRLGFVWAFLTLLAWHYFPSPHAVSAFPSWAVMTRWLGIALLGLLVSHVAMLPDLQRRRYGMALAGLLWGFFSFVSQENLMGGLLVTVLTFAFLSPLCRSALFDDLQCLATFFGVGLVSLS
jgi:hypothetical protein